MSARKRKEEVSRLRSDDAEAVPSQVRYWSEHGWKHGRIVAVMVVPYGRKLAVKVPISDVKAEGSDV